MLWMSTNPSTSQRCNGVCSPPHLSLRDTFPIISRQIDRERKRLWKRLRLWERVDRNPFLYVHPLFFHDDCHLIIFPSTGDVMPPPFPPSPLPLTVQLTPNTRVALRNDSYTLHKVLPNKASHPPSCSPSPC